MGKYHFNRRFTFRLVLVMLVVSGVVACDFFPGKPKRVEFLDNAFSVDMPSSWSVRNDLNDVADLQMGNIFKEAYTIIISEHKSDFDDMTLEDHSDLTRSMLRQGVKNYRESEPEFLDIWGNRAIRYELSGSVDGVNVVYWHVTIETAEHYHQMLLWSLQSKFAKNKPDFDFVIQSFEEKTS